MPLKRQRVLRPGLVTDLTHLLVNTVLVTVGAIGARRRRRDPLLLDPALRPRGRPAHGPCRSRSRSSLVFARELLGPPAHAHRCRFLWRFHSVHHSIEQMDWVAAGRLHPFDSGVHPGVHAPAAVRCSATAAGVFAGVAVFITLLAIFQHANVRIRFPVLRWVIPTPEWHHWHHAIDDEARDQNFGLPVVDKIFGTAYLPKGPAPHRLRHPLPGSPDGYLNHLALPLRPLRDLTPEARAPGPRSTSTSPAARPRSSEAPTSQEGDVVTAPPLSAEGATLLATLQSQRAHVLGILEGLDADTLRRTVLPTGWNMLGMVNHLTYDIEQFWFRAIVAGEQPVIDHLPTGDEGWRVPDARSADEVLEAYRTETALADAIIRPHPSTRRPPGGPPTSSGPSASSTSARSCCTSSPRPPATPATSMSPASSSTAERGCPHLSTRRPALGTYISVRAWPGRGREPRRPPRPRLPAWSWGARGG